MEHDERVNELLNVMADQIEILAEALKEMAAADRYPAPRLPHGRPLTPDSERLARDTALSDIEDSTEPVAIRARMWRAMAQNAVAGRRYQAAGFLRWARSLRNWPVVYRMRGLQPERAAAGTTVSGRSRLI